jgi:hypothetical protein
VIIITNIIYVIAKGVMIYNIIQYDFHQIEHRNQTSQNIEITINYCGYDNQ